MKHTFILVILALASSCDYLSINDYIDNDLAIDTIFTQKRYIEAYMWGATTYLPDEGAIFSNPYTPGPMATDEAFCEFNSGEFQGMGFVLGERNETSLGSFDKWHTWYQVIRQCNTIFNRMDEVRDWTISERQRIVAYTRFIRAYAYYLLLMNYGPVVLLGDEVVENNENIAYYDRPRDLYDDCVEYICSEFEEASRDMPYSVASVVEFGQPTKGAALALTARLRLQHASNLYNGGNAARMYFGNWIRKTDGKHYIQQTYDRRRWAVAAAAAIRVINLKDDAGTNLYELHTVLKDNKTPPLSENTSDPDYLNLYPLGADGIDPYHSYADMFNGEAVASVNKEFIWARTSSSITNFTRYTFPNANGGYNGACVTQKIIDAYEMADGRSIDASSEEYPYSEAGFTTTAREMYNGYRLNAGVYNMYNNREARFYASIGFSECFWEMASTTDVAQKNLTITYYSDAPNGKELVSNSSYYPITGYVMRKYNHPNDAWAGEAARRIAKTYPIIRLAEIMLSYVEALNELGSEAFTVDVDGEQQTFSRDIEQIRKYYNQVRYRAGLPGLTDFDLGDYNIVLSKIKRERMIEFLFENRRYFDVRRWGDYELSESATVMGMNTASPKDAYYQRVVPGSSRISRRVVDRKMIFLPLPKTELKRLPAFDQNPGW
ncbi:MAG: RagB/SusD family nutrient uptake outer membrane protein [Tannerella sp.]|jgi:hypothetical protein|nr:RagB/SusD family nutrient uptake outer membrane protein [Tannerella sp.]